MTCGTLSGHSFSKMGILVEEWKNHFPIIAKELRDESIKPALLLQHCFHIIQTAQNTLLKTDSVSTTLFIPNY